MVQAGQSVSLTCNLTSSGDVTWYHLRSDQPLPLLTVRSARVGGETVNFHAADTRRISSRGALENSSLALEVLEVEERDAGLYFCTGRCAGDVCVNRGVRLAVNGKKATSFYTWTEYICSIAAVYLVVLVINKSTTGNIWSHDGSRGNVRRIHPLQERSGGFILWEPRMSWPSIQ